MNIRAFTLETNLFRTLNYARPSRPRSLGKLTSARGQQKVLLAPYYSPSNNGRCWLPSPLLSFLFSQIIVA